MLTRERLNQLQNYGFTDNNAAIVDAIWFTDFFSPRQICMVLIVDAFNTWNARIGITEGNMTESQSALWTATYGDQLPCAIAQAAFPSRFESNEYKN